MKQVIYTEVTNCDIPHWAQMKLLAAFATNEGKQLKITLERGRKKRSLSVNAYYWGVVIPACQGILTDFGNDVDEEETHSFLKEHIGKLTGSVVDSKGTRRAIVKSSASLETQEFRAYLDRIIRWAAGEGVVIPDPNQDLYQPVGEKIV